MTKRTKLTMWTEEIRFARIGNRTTGRDTEGLPVEERSSLRKVIGENMKARGLKSAELAASLGVERACLSKLLTGALPITPKMAVRFEQALGVPAAFLMDIRAAEELKQARAELARLEGMPATVRRFAGV
jgi:addiction module HigA family antidote